MKVIKLTKRKVCANITVENKEAFRISSSDLIPEVVKSSSSSKFHELLEITDVHTILALNFVEEALEFCMVIRADDENFFETWNQTTSIDVMFNYW